MKKYIGKFIHNKKFCAFEHVYFLKPESVLCKKMLKMHKLQIINICRRKYGSI